MLRRSQPPRLPTTEDGDVSRSRHPLAPPAAAAVPDAIVLRPLSLVLSNSMSLPFAFLSPACSLSSRPSSPHDGECHSFALLARWLQATGPRVPPLCPASSPPASLLSELDGCHSSVLCGLIRQWSRLSGPCCPPPAYALQLVRPELLTAAASSAWSQTAAAVLGRLRADVGSLQLPGRSDCDGSTELLGRACIALVEQWQVSGRCRHAADPLPPFSSSSHLPAVCCHVLCSASASS